MPNLADLTELHTHLSTSVSSHLLRELAHQQGIALPEKDYWKFMERIKLDGSVDYAKFHDFFDINQTIQSSPFGVEKSVHEAIGLGYRKCDIRTVEIRFNPMKRNKDGLFDLDKVIFAGIIGMKRACMEYPVKAGIIIEMDKRFTYTQNQIIVEKAIRFAGQGVVGIDISGPSVDGFSFKTLAPLFALAKQAGLGITVHAGEEQGPAEIREAMEYAQPQRIGHGIQAIHDRALMQALAKAGTVLEVCPTSNILTKLKQSYEDFKEIFNAFDDVGVRYTICADNPILLQTNVKKEYENLYTKGILSADDIERCKQTAKEATFIKQ